LTTAHITRTPGSWSSARGALPLLLHRTLSGDYAGVVTGGHIFDVPVGEYSSLVSDSFLSHHGLFKL